ncbi:hypothetical protein BMF94_1641 [Rhodotorula taiwanensis]|uniref:Ammonium transporter n=1 Tax=Rhodotorula taiwanensis TaxID=741276 RepID=A0A2S5BET7_9BASI|nr:hypothetical protein BMF94_1641 [Rhodotorula taiwanensis]
MINITHTPEGNLLTYVNGEPVICTRISHMLPRLYSRALTIDFGRQTTSETVHRRTPRHRLRAHSPRRIGRRGRRVITATVIVHIMPIGLGLLYSGLMRRKNALSMLFLAMSAYAVGTLQWWLMGYSLTYSETGSTFIGTLRYGAGVGVDIQPSPGSTAIPALLYFIYQAQFQSITACVLVAGTAERGRMLPFLILAFAWCTVVYNPIARWVWSSKGWLYPHDLDFAGGGPVHIASGTGSVVLAFFVGPRRGYGTAKLDYRPQSPLLIALGTAFLWFGHAFSRFLRFWNCFNGASMSALNLKSMMCVSNTVLAGCAGALSWTTLDFIWTRKYSAIGISSGILAGLIGITPAVGYVGLPAAFAVGAITAVVANLSTSLKHYAKIDDAVDAGALHGMGGICGAIVTGIFADSRVASFDGMTEIEGGWINGNFKQMGWQLAGCLTIVTYTAVVTYILCFVINLIPGCKFRSSEEAEIVGIDEAEIGEFTFDYVLLDQDYQPRQRVPNDPKLAAAARLSTIREEEKSRAGPGTPSSVSEAELDKGDGVGVEITEVQRA